MNGVCVAPYLASLNRVRSKRSDNAVSPQVVEEGVLKRLIEIISSSNDRNLVVPALRTLGNIVTGSDTQTQAVIDIGALHAFRYEGTQWR